MHEKFAFLIFFNLLNFLRLFFRILIAFDENMWGIFIYENVPHVFLSSPLFVAVIFFWFLTIYYLYWTKVISPELIREVEARMNRNYLPPSLKHANPSAVGSPPTGNSYILSSKQRHLGRTCKLPTVQEVMGKFIKRRM